MSNISPVKKFVLKFNLSAYRPSVTCEAAKFHSELIGDYKFSNVTRVKNLLVKHFIAREEAADYDNKQQQQQQQQQTIWIYNVNTKNTTVTVYAAPEINFIPLPGDLEAMQVALTSAKIGATFFDSQIEKHLESVGIKTTCTNVRVYRKSYIAQISKMLLEEILNKPSTATIARHFDKINGNSYFSVNLSNGILQINVPMSYGYGNSEGLVIRALRLDWPRTKSARDVLNDAGINVVDLGYRNKGELYKAAFYI